MAIGCHAYGGGIKGAPLPSAGFAAPVLSGGSGFSSGYGSTGFVAPLPAAHVPVAPLPVAHVPVAPLPARFEAAIHSRRTYQVIPVPHQPELVQPQIIEVPAGELPVQVLFRTVSSRLNVQQTHTPGKVYMNISQYF